jgi:hypothetical protein
MIEESGWPGDISVPDIITLSQFQDMNLSRALSPDKRLAMAIFMDGIECYQRDAAVFMGSTKQDRAEAREWLTSTTDQGPYSFEHLCELFGLEPKETRARVLAGKVTRFHRTTSAGRP